MNQVFHKWMKNYQVKLQNYTTNNQKEEEKYKFKH